MLRKTLKFFLLLAFVALSAGYADAQIDASTSNGRPQQKEELPKNIQETLQKQQIEREKKDFEEMLKNGEEATKISTELEDSFAKSNSLTAQDLKKLERMEKLLKKIRRELGGDDDDGGEDVAAETEFQERSSTIVTAVKKLQSDAANLLDELKKTTRFSVSVIAIQSSNTLLRIVRFIKLKQ